jgi:surfactin synthase thioesterase subunit
MNPVVNPSPTRWARRFLAPHPAPALRVFCFPYAGAGASIFHDWRLPAHLAAEVWAVQPPGRENRRDEPPVRRLDLLVAAYAEQLAPLLDRPFAFFGHSMGALAAFELTRLLRRRGDPLPARLLLAAHRAPHLPPTREAISPLRWEPFLDRLREMAAGSPAVILDPDVIRRLEPTMRVDFELCERYTYRPDAPLPVPVTGFAAVDDCEVDVAGVAAWESHTTAGFRLRTYLGGHLFLREHAAAVLADVAVDLAT